MCNLYKILAKAEEVRNLGRALGGTTPNWPPEYDVFPNYSAPVIVAVEGGRELRSMKWGFPGPTVAGGRPVTNVRNLASPFWRTALSKPERRCLVPFSAFCEWEGEKGSKRKVWFESTDQSLGFFAGIWRPLDADNAAFAFLTCEPNEIVGAVHPKAMPVILQPDDHERWLTDEYVTACELATPYDNGKMNIVEEAAA